MVMRKRVARRGRKAPMRKRNYNRGPVRRRNVAGCVHMIKRLGKTVFIRNDASVGGAPFLFDNGAGQFFQGSPLAGSLPGTWDFTMSSQYQLASVLDPADLTSLYDRYRIVGVSLKFHYLQNASFIPGNNANLPTLYWAFDGDDANVPASTTEVAVKGYCKSKVLNANRPLSVYIKPRITKEIYSSPITTGYSSEKACWLDCASSGIPHFGLKMALVDWVGGADANNALRIQPTYYLALRDTQ